MNTKNMYFLFKIVLFIVSYHFLFIYLLSLADIQIEQNKYRNNLHSHLTNINKRIKPSSPASINHVEE